jgi:hypothetical protein
MAEASIPLSSFSLGETLSDSEPPVDRVAASKNLIYYLALLLKLLIFCYKLDPALDPA